MEQIWIVQGEKNGKVELISKRNSNSGIVPVGTYLTVQTSTARFLLIVSDSSQVAVFQPSYLMTDLDLGAFEADRESKNKILAVRIHDLDLRKDGLIDYIIPLSKARLSTSEEIHIGLNSKSNIGPSVFPATVHNNVVRKLKTSDTNSFNIQIPLSAYWHQIQITGKTGSGKTVASKYLAHHFLNSQVDGKYGCVLAINVKDTDFLEMNRGSNSIGDEIKKEWGVLGIDAEAIYNFEVLYNSYKSKNEYLQRGVADTSCFRPVTLSASKLDAEALLGIVENVTQLGQQALPDIFRYWQANYQGKGYDHFLEYYENGMLEDHTFKSIDLGGRVYEQKLNPSTSSSLIQRLRTAGKFFDNDSGSEVKVEQIVQEGKMTVIDVSDNISFGSIVLRFLLSEILRFKNEENSKIPVLIIIDEVHQFYKTSASGEALGILDTISRVGRSKKIGVIFSSQNEKDLPTGISSVVNSKFSFKSDEKFKVNGRDILMNSLKAGYCYSRIHGLPDLNFCKFPLSPSGVIKN